MNDNEDYEWYDDDFRVEQMKWGTWRSFTKDGKEQVTAMTKDQCISGTRFYLNGVRNGWGDEPTTKYDGTVGGKL